MAEAGGEEERRRLLAGFAFLHHVHCAALSCSMAQSATFQSSWSSSRSGKMPQSISGHAAGHGVELLRRPGAALAVIAPDGELGAVLAARGGWVGVVEDLAGRQGPIALRGEVLRQRDHVAQGRRGAEPDVERVDPGGRGTQPGQEAGARRVAQGRLAVGVGKQRPAPRQPVHVGCLDLRVPLQAADPVVQVVDAEEQDVGPRRRGLRFGLFRQGHLPRRHQVGDQVADLVGGEDVELPVGHERELRRADLLDVAAIDDQAFGGGLEGQGRTGSPVVADDAVEQPAVGQGEGRHPVVGGHGRRGVDDVLQQVAEVRPLGAGEVGPDLASGAEERVAVGAGLHEQLAAVRQVGGGERLGVEPWSGAGRSARALRRGWSAARARAPSRGGGSSSSGKPCIWRIWNAGTSARSTSPSATAASKARAQAGRELSATIASARASGRRLPKRRSRRPGVPGSSRAARPRIASAPRSRSFSRPFRSGTRFVGPRLDGDPDRVAARGEVGVLRGHDSEQLGHRPAVAEDDRQLADEAGDRLVRAPGQRGLGRRPRRRRRRLSASPEAPRPCPSGWRGAGRRWPTRPPARRAGRPGPEPASGPRSDAAPGSGSGAASGSTRPAPRPAPRPRAPPARCRTRS